ncbi:MAG: sigma-70 family RNA polymerase sigma factor [Oscillospiraceae bacterium]
MGDRVINSKEDLKFNYRLIMLLDVIDKFDLPLDDIERISDRLLTIGIILRENDNHTISTDDEDDESNNRSKIDYDLMFDEIIEMYPSLKGFINEVRIIPPPQAKEVDTLIYQAIDGNKYAYDRIIKMYLKVVVRMAYLLSKQYYLPLEDTIQDGVIGLISAYKSYNPTSGKRFSTQSGWVIRNAIIREAPTINPQMYFPLHIKEHLFSIYDIVFEHQCEYCSDKVFCPELVQNISDKLEIDNETAYSFLQYLINFESFDLMLENDDCSFGDNDVVEVQVIEDLYAEELNEQLLLAVANLGERESEVLKYRYGFYNGQEKTLEEVGSIFGVTRERIRQIEVKAIKKLHRNKRIRSLLRI